ncbi:MAG: UDP-N-acetylglucosamine 2-epimerase, partial [Clostridium sp.]
DVMFDAIKLFKEKALETSTVLIDNNISPNEYILSTIHRAENTNDINRLKNIINALNECEKNIVLPLHPRTHKFIKDYGLTINNNIKIIAPVGYLDMINLENNSQKIVTDSGGVQKEAYFLQKPCITMRDETEWIETVENGWNTIVGSNKEKILDAIINFNPNGEQKMVFGYGNAADIISEKLK